ncbi:MAG: hypothetical protein FWG33_04340 [Oscillospiraceae bacterium]|nr:hypothetical protein [Oscillospiraceae bacterium]
MRKLSAVLTASVFFAVTLMSAVGASPVYSESNRNIGILFGEFTGYKFAPADDIDPSEIAKLKYYIKVDEPIEDIMGTVIELAYHSDTTGWVNQNHDLEEEGLITEMDVEPGITVDDFFEAGLINWNEGVTGTFSIELLDSDGNVIGPSAIEPSIQEVTTSPESETGVQGSEETRAETEIEPSTNNVQNNRNARPGQRTQTNAPEIPPPTANAAQTGRTNIITASVMSVLSICAIISMRKKK